MKKPALLPLLLLAGCQPAPEPAAWSGYAEGEYVYVAPALSGRLQRLAVQAGQDVPAGALLFAQDATPEREALLEAQARERAAQAQAGNLQQGRRPDELAVVQAQAAQARSQLARLTAELQREQDLQRRGFVSPARLDDLRLQRAAAEQRVLELDAQLRVAKLPGRSSEQAAASATREAQQAQAAQAAWRAAQREQHAPAAARVAETFFRPGEWVNAGQPVLALLPPAGRKARFFVPERELGGLKVGQAVRLSCDGCGAPIAAEIQRIATRPEYTPPVLYSNAQRAKLVFLVEARPNREQDALRLQPGQPLDVRPAS